MSRKSALKLVRGMCVELRVRTTVEPADKLRMNPATSERLKAGFYSSGVVQHIYDQ